MRHGSNLPHVSSFNRAVVLEAIRHSGHGLTRAQLGRVTGLSAQTVSNVTRTLLDHKLVRETGVVTQEGRGRPGMALELDPTGGFAVGIHIDPSALGVAVVDLTGEVVVEHHGPLPSPQDPEALVEHLHHRVRQMVADAGVADARLLGIGVAAPGPIDDKAGSVSPPLLPDWGTVPLRPLLARATGVDVVLGKDVIAAAKAALWTGEAPDRKDFLVVYIGAGAAIVPVIEGQVVRGTSGNAGETMHLPGDPASGSPHRWTLGGCLGERELVAHAHRLGIDLPGSAESWDPHVVSLGFTRLLGLAHAGDSRALGVFGSAGRVLGTAVLVVAELLDVTAIVMTGPRWESVRSLCEPALHEVVDDHAVHGQARPLTLHTSRLAASSGTVGAACLILDRLFSPDHSRLLITQ
ncbi:MAG: ROK family transcriptional regulator [Actinomyces sp.]|uniref:ROK family transcriptional regulator n=1 Tax=Actinomyces sp. TaxID=29317 RepID=UPI0026DC8164|nr:ROK family transcriptional regulator [Actinomyces sp.]MDO4242850.1 ROK family transcriptional regulator [Actinomyces sp.]